MRQIVREAAPLVLVTAALLATFDPIRWPTLTFALLALAFAAYLRAALRLEHRASASSVLLVAVVLRLLMLPLPPTLSDDTLRYAWDGKVLRSGSNPYLLAPESPQLETLRDARWEVMPHQHVPTVYPPLALGVFTVGSALPDPLLGIKILLCFAELVGCWLLIGVARRLGLGPGRAIWYCWNPLAVIEVAGMGHVDGLGVLAVVALAGWLASGRTWRAAAAAAAGVLAKLIPLIAVPMWARQSRRPWLFSAVVLGIVGLLMLPVVLSVGGVPPGLVTYGISWEFNGPLYEPLWRAFERVELDAEVKGLLDVLKERTGRHDLWNRFYPYVYPQLMAKLVLLMVFGCFVLYSVFGGGLGGGDLGAGARDPNRVILGSGRLFGGFVLCAATVYPWYLLWVLPWAALAPATGRGWC